MNQSKQTQQLQTGIALLRITLGIIILATWYDNLNKGLYTAEGLTGFLNWLFDAENGNASSLTFYKTILDATVIPTAGLFAIFQLITELILGLGLLLGGFTRLFGLGAMFFFLNLFLSYFGGNEWIWLYVLLFMAATAVFLGHAGRKWGIDAHLLKQRGEPPYPVLW